MRTPVLIVILGVAVSGCADDVSPPPAGDEPVYYGEVERLLDEHCVRCHGTEADRLAPFSLATYDDAVAAAIEQPLTFAVMSRVMPPYYANQDGSCQTFHDVPYLDDDEIATLVA